MEDEKITVFEGRIMIGSGEPPRNLEPPIIGFLWIDYTKPTIYSCVDNNKDNVRWCHLDQAEIIALNNRMAKLEERVRQYQRLVNEYSQQLDDYLDGRW